MNDEIDDAGSPGQLLQALLRARGWSQRTLAAILAVGEATITRLLGGRQPVDAKLAIALEEIFGVAAERFLSLQRDFDLAEARKAVRPDRTRATRACLYARLPVSEMIRRGWLDAKDIRDTVRVDAALTRFFGAERLGDIEILPHAPKVTAVSGEVTATQLAWLRRVGQIAGGMAGAAYCEQTTRAALPQLRVAMATLQGVTGVPRILAACGIRFVIVESLAAAAIDGGCLWLDGQAPVIALTLRLDRIEHFWFVLRRQIEHILRRRGHGGAMIDIAPGGEPAGAARAAVERVADEAAREFCLPASQLDAVLARHGPLLSEGEMLAMARTLGLHPGILARHIQRRTGKYERFGIHDVRLRQVIGPYAVTDGW
jgi:HTH-type transcriptional regulator/antitoxin HigA